MPADEVELPDSLRARLPGVHGFVQRLFLPLVYLQMTSTTSTPGWPRKHVYKQAIYAQRGAILDTNNEVWRQHSVETVVAA